MKIAQPRDGEPIRLVIKQDGTPSYRVVLDGDPFPNGKRRQLRSTHRTLGDARTHVATHKTDRERGLLIAQTRQTFKEYAETWLAIRARRVREVTSRSYASCLAHAYAAFGDKALARVTRADVEQVVERLSTAGRSKRRASLVLFVLRSVFNDAVHDGLIGRNPAARVEAAGREAKQREALSRADLGKLCQHFATDRLYPCWLLTLNGLRRSEVLGLKWSDVDLDSRTVRIERGRVDVDGKRTIETPTKTRRGTRTLPLSSDLLAALHRLREAQLAEFGAEQVRSGYLAVDAAGEPMRPERWTDLWKEACVAAKVPSVTLHAARHSSVTAMRDAEVPDHIVAAFHGHDEYVMRSVYSHADATGLSVAAEALAAALNGRSPGA